MTLFSLLSFVQFILSDDYSIQLHDVHLYKWGNTVSVVLIYSKWPHYPLI